MFPGSFTYILKIADGDGFQQGKHELTFLQLEEHIKGIRRVSRSCSAPIEVRSSFNRTIVDFLCLSPLDAILVYFRIFQRPITQAGH